MGYVRYKELDSSEVSWLQKKPKHWRVKRLKFSTDLINSKLSVEESPLPYLGLEHIESWTGRKIDGEINNSEGLASSFVAGDVLFGKLRPYLAKVHLAQQDGLISSEALVVRSMEELHAEFLKYYMLSRDFINIVDSSTYGSKMPRASWDFIGNLPVLLPEIEEQKAIARFLDFKTTQIDALIAKKRTLLDKLAESRTALISHAVTMGLDPSVPMKDSGVAWLGKVPAHWKITRIKFVARIGNGSTPNREKSDYWIDGYFPWLNSSVVNQDEVTESDQFVTDLALKECHLPIVHPPAVLVGITGQGKTRGMASKLSVIATINQHLAYIKPTTLEIRVDYLLFMFERAYPFLRSESDGGGSTKGAITCEQIANLEIALPPATEQASIELHLATKLEKSRDMNRRVLAVVEKLQEYRSALITNAVTGKIDVRDFKIPQSAEGVAS
jgi:type I restriction enzyme S subunit